MSKGRPGNRLKPLFQAGKGYLKPFRVFMRVGEHSLSYVCRRFEAIVNDLILIRNNFAIVFANKNVVVFKFGEAIGEIRSVNKFKCLLQWN